MTKNVAVVLCFVASVYLLENRASAQLQNAAAEAKKTLDPVVTGNAAKVNADFVNEAVIAISKVLEKFPESASAPEPVEDMPSCEWEWTTQCVPVYGCFGRFRGYRRIRVAQRVQSKTQKYKAVSSDSIEEALQEELTKIREVLKTIDTNQVDEIILLSKDAFGIIRIIQRRELE